MTKLSSLTLSAMLLSAMLLSAVAMPALAATAADVAKPAAKPASLVSRVAGTEPVRTPAVTSTPMAAVPGASHTGTMPGAATPAKPNATVASPVQPTKPAATKTN